MPFLALDPAFEASKVQSSETAGRCGPFPCAGASTQYVLESISVPEVGLVSVLPRRLHRCWGALKPGQPRAPDSTSEKIKGNLKEVSENLEEILRKS